MKIKEIRDIILQELPAILEQDKEVLALVLRLSEGRFADKEKTEDRFDRILNELAADRVAESKKWEEEAKRWEEQNKKWTEHIKRSEEQDKKWAEQVKRWEEQDKKWADETRRWEEQREEQSKKWADEARRWEEQREEQDKKWADEARRWEEQRDEQSKKWADEARRWEEQGEEQSNKWDDEARRWEEQREEQSNKWDDEARRWEEQREEQGKKWADEARRWEEQEVKWHENQKVIHELLDSVKALNNKTETTLGAIGARWGIRSELSFRNAFKGLLSTATGLEVTNVVEYDAEGFVFGFPDQIELDLVVKNGLLIICEIKSSVSKPDIYIFLKKAEFYQKRHFVKADRLIVISPMIDKKALELARNWGIKTYSYVDDIEPDVFSP